MKLVFLILILTIVESKSEYLYLHPVSEDVTSEGCTIFARFLQKFFVDNILLNECVHFVDSEKFSTAHREIIKCGIDSINKNILSSVILQDFETNVNFNVTTFKKFNCDLYMYVIESYDTVGEIFSVKPGRKRYYSFSRLLIIYMDVPEKFRLTRQHLQFISMNSLDVLWTSYDPLSDSITLYHTLRNYTITESIGVNDKKKLLIFNENELINTILRDERKLQSIRTSLFNCPPYVIYRNSSKYKNTIVFDGAEYRSFYEIAKNWNISINRSDVAGADNWDRVLNNVLTNRSDVAMCSVWISEEHINTFDMSENIGSQCVTFVVPQPTIQSQASIVYLPFSIEVWGAFLFIFLFTSFQIKGISIIGERIFNNFHYSRRYRDLTKTIVEMTSIATSHGASIFPVATPVKILVTAWLVLSLLLDTGYTTGYTSIMTIPRYSKSIDNFKDFIDQNLAWGELSDNSATIKALVESNVTEYIELAGKFIKEASIQDRLKRLESGHYARMVKVRMIN